MKKRNYYFLLFLFSFFNVTAQEVDTLQYVFQWGDFTQPLDSESNSISINTTLDSLKNVLDHPVQVFNNDKNINIESFSISLFNPRRKDLTRILHFDKYDVKKAAKLHGDQEIGSFLTTSTQMYMVNMKLSDGFTFFVRFSLQPPQIAYKPPIELPLTTGGDIFEFQVVSFENEKTILRIDTTNSAQKHIVDIYRNPDKYRIVHIPNFKTVRRFVENTDLITFSNLPTSVLIEDKSLVNTTFITVPEFYNYSKHREPFIIQWGEMKNIESKIYNETEVINEPQRHLPEDILDAIGSPFLLTHGFKDFEIVKMRVTILPETKAPISFITDHLNHPQITIEMENISNHTTILFDEIFIKGNENEIVFLPPAFMFVIE